MLIISLILLLLFIFVGLIFMLRRILTQNVVLATNHLEELSQEFAQKEKEIGKQLDEAKKKSQEMVALARQEAEKLKEEIIKDAENQKDKIVSAARVQGEEAIEQADKSRQTLLSEINERIDREAIKKACELIRDALPEQFRLDAHKHWVNELIEAGFSSLQHLNLPPDAKDAKITSAFALEESQRKAIYKKIKDIVGSEAKIREEIDSAIIAGLVISLGSLVLDSSLKNKVQERAKDVQSANNK
ncbi:MAG: F0F1 ATP synthase subunit delta [bacterium]